MIGLKSREDLPRARRAVVKVGSSSITGKNVVQLPRLVAGVMGLYARGCQVILVSSGAIATALPIMGLESRPRSLDLQQAAAAVGQTRLMMSYQNLFDAYRVTCGQVLLTAADFQRPESRQNAAAVLEKMLELEILPIVNENDATSTSELCFGDNDSLASLVAILAQAEVLVLLSDVEALYTKPPDEPGARLISRVAYGDSLPGVTVTSGGGSKVGSGGAVTKLAAARRAASAGIPTLLAPTRLADSALLGKALGTWFEAGGLD